MLKFIKIEPQQAITIFTFTQRKIEYGKFEFDILEHIATKHKQ
jgi:hypothetical protein